MIDLERRLARFGDAIDELVDPAVASQLGERSTVQVVDTTRVRRRSMVPVGPALAAAVIVIAVVVAALLVGQHTDAPVAAHPPPMWERSDARSAGFSDRLSATCCARIGEHLVAFGEAESLSPFQGGIWTSTDGRLWTRARVDDAEGKTIEIVASINGHAIALPSDDDSGTFWASTDGRQWHKDVSPSLIGHAASQVFRFDGRLVLVDNTLGSARLLTSSDGTTWTPLSDAPFSGTFAAFRGGILGLEHTYEAGASVTPQVWFSADGASWTRVDSNLPRAFGLFVPDGQRDAFVTAYDGPGLVGGHLWRSADGVTWTEVVSLQEAFPNSIPFQLTRAGEWWITSGWDTTDGRRISLWWSRDLEHWSELPRRLRGAQTANHAALLSANRTAVVAFSDSAIWRWVRP